MFSKNGMNQIIRDIFELKLPSENPNEKNELSINVWIGTVKYLQLAPLLLHFSWIYLVQEAQLKMDRKPLIEDLQVLEVQLQHHLCLLEGEVPWERWAQKSTEQNTLAAGRGDGFSRLVTGSSLGLRNKKFNKWNEVVKEIYLKYNLWTYAECKIPLYILWRFGKCNLLLFWFGNVWRSWHIWYKGSLK